MNSEKQSTNLQMTLREVNRVGEVKKNIPKLRFRGYEDAWEQRKAKRLFVSWVDKGYPDLPVLSATQDKGMVRRDENGINIHYDEKNKSGYKRVMPGQFVIHLRSFQGGFAYSEVEGITSPAYTVFDFKEFDKHIPEFWKYVFSSKDFIRRLEKVTYGIRDGRSIGFEDFLTLKFNVPEKREQKVIAEILAGVNNLITLHQRKYDALKSMKKTLLSKMFPKNGEDVPEIRFKEFTDAWEQRKFGNIIQIERGGSPRPIEEYITTSSDGLNWVKIGDAPNQGNYITSTSEKIRPEGLSKTREVYPGDLILSNSMSFGKPYIMAIKGCIHDGWLLLRDKNNYFDLIFLCNLLGTPQMLQQYKGLAAGSTVNNLNKELVSSTQVCIPNIEEQKTIGIFFETIDNLITLHQRKLDGLKNMKKTLLQQMFV